MTELKTIDLDNIRESIENDEPVYYEYYAKSEADRVIAQLETKIDSLQRENQILNQYKLVAHSSYGIGGAK